jgi:hypothetical protein
MAGTSREANFALPGHDDGKLQRSSQPSLRGVKRRSNPAFLAGSRWIASLALAMTTSDNPPRRTVHPPPHSHGAACPFFSLPREAWGGWLTGREAISETGGGGATCVLPRGPPPGASRHPRASFARLYPTRRRDETVGAAVPCTMTTTHTSTFSRRDLPE